jgi:ArsR family transcriptional regulator, zinc-responsive transcriptional repressor
MQHNGDLQPAEELFKALASAQRIAILRELGRGPRCVHELAEALEVPQPRVSQHLRILRGARLVAATRRAQEVVYSLQDTHVAHIIEDAVHHSIERKEQ